MTRGKGGSYIGIQFFAPNQLFSCSPGYIVEWCRPHDIDLEGVEFKSMASGSHRFQSDFIFLMEQNNRIFQTLLEVASSQDKTLTVEHARSMGLDSQGDRTFLMDLMLVIDDPCCPDPGSSPGNNRLQEKEAPPPMRTKIFPVEVGTVV
ncbi:hypothetical protein XELAEV_18019793mg [Xenopus laevis]|uniref:Uncharacterized protein n=1 Tax=Xenopus laevis TaxID=8355 RepID=A0A974D5W4_XENLA|nr:hypothetical protein XELAEV_18019793mg [Xenopus laevis]